MMNKIQIYIPDDLILDFIHHLGIAAWFLSMKYMVIARARRSITSEPVTTFSKVGMICSADSERI